MHKKVVMNKLRDFLFDDREKAALAFFDYLKRNGFIKENSQKPIQDLYKEFHKEYDKLLKYS
jgi:hypothetical protein